ATAERCSPERNTSIAWGAYSTCDAIAARLKRAERELAASSIKKRECARLADIALPASPKLASVADRDCVSCADARSDASTAACERIAACQSSRSRTSIALRAASERSK